MNTAGVVAVSVLFGLFLCLLLLLLATLVYLVWRSRRDLLAFQAQMPLLIAEYRTTLTEQIGLLNAKIGQIKGEEISHAAEIIVQSARRIENAAVAFGELSRALLGEDELGLRKAKESGLAPEAYAPPEAAGTPYISLSRTAAADSRARAQESGEGEEDI